MRTRPLISTRFYRGCGQRWVQLVDSPASRRSTASPVGVPVQCSRPGAAGERAQRDGDDDDGDEVWDEVDRQEEVGQEQPELDADSPRQGGSVASRRSSRISSGSSRSASRRLVWSGFACCARHSRGHQGEPQQQQPGADTSGDGQQLAHRRSARMPCSPRAALGAPSALLGVDVGGERGSFEALQRRTGPVQLGSDLPVQRGVVVVPGGDLGQPGFEAGQVGLGFLDLGEGDVAAGGFSCPVRRTSSAAARAPRRIRPECPRASPLQLRALGGVAHLHGQHPSRAALGADLHRQPAHCPGDLGPARQQADRLLHIQRAQPAQPPPDRHPQRVRPAGRADRDQQPPLVSHPGHTGDATDVTSAALRWNTWPYCAPSAPT